MSQVKIRDIDNNPIILMNVRLAVGDGNSVSAYDDKFSDYAGNLAWPNPLPSSNGYNLHVNYANENYDWDRKSVKVDTLNPPPNPNDPEAENIIIKLNRAPRKRAIITDLYSNVFFKGESAFLDLARLCHGQDIRPLLRQSVSVGSNGRRNFLMTYNTAKAAGLPPFNPDDFPDFYFKVEELLQIYAEYGLYLYGSVFPDNQLFDSWKDQTNKQKDHWGKIGEIAKRNPNCWALELTNEINGHVFNQVQTDQFSKISGVICCSGSLSDNGGNPFPDPQWDIVDFHFPRGYPKSVKDACQADNPDRLFKGRAVMGGEPLGFGHGRETRTRIAKEIAGSSRGTCCGIVFHSTSGGFSQTYDANEVDCANAWFNELKGT